MKTHSLKAKEIKREWHLIDAKDKVLGRLASQIAQLLMGKHKPYFARHLDCGDFVVVINAKEVKVTGKKEKQKIYYRHSGYPGALKETTLGQMRKKYPERIIIKAVEGMLPKNRLKDEMLTRLKVQAGEDHPYQSKFKAQNPKSRTNSNNQNSNV
jgi:large subunit ribosomal protein L13